nr:MAG TPA: hypothetical protein [Caudoviricetes sp.]DAZ12210.1 MAG TPA: hypothetical protein [Caudoviricetes sp.]
MNQIIDGIARKSRKSWIIVLISSHNSMLTQRHFDVF